MVKTRMGLLDLRAQTHTLNQTLIGSRVANIYDTQNGRTYIFKLQTPPPPSSTATPWQKQQLLIESGARIHLTNYDRAKDVPTGLCLKLRKHVKARRLEAVKQIGDDRIVELTFSGGGEVVARVILECFGGGNVVLTDADYNVLAALRMYKGGKGVKIREKYPMERAKGRDMTSFEDFEKVWREVLSDMPTEEQVQQAETKAERRKLEVKRDGKKVLGGKLGVEPVVVQHAMEIAGGRGKSIAEWDEGILKGIYEGLKGVEEIVKGELKGYILKGNDGKMQEFSMMRWAQWQDREVDEYGTFDESVDVYFAWVEAERKRGGREKRERGVRGKVEKLRGELEKRERQLEEEVDKYRRMARAIEGGVEEVDAVLTVINSAVQSGIGWEELQGMVEKERETGNIVAQVIYELKLDKNQVVVMLEDIEAAVGEEEADEDEGEEEEEEDEEQNDDEEQIDNERVEGFQSRDAQKVLLVPIDLDLSAHANAREYYDLMRTAAAKQDKAASATTRTLKAATRRAELQVREIEREALSASIRAQRKTHWFEKFAWFVTTEGYLVVGGRDAQQSELLVYRYMAATDVYVYAEGVSVILKNSSKEVPQMSLEQAASFALCRSPAWGGSVLSSAWWVWATQVEKGQEELPVGSFFIRGRKTILQPRQLVMGIGFLFGVGEDAVDGDEVESDEKEEVEEGDQGNGKEQTVDVGAKSLQAVGTGDSETVAQSNAPAQQSLTEDDTTPDDEAEGEHERPQMEDTRGSAVDGEDVEKDDDEQDVASTSDTPQEDASAQVEHDTAEITTHSSTAEGVDQTQSMSRPEAAVSQKATRSKKKHLSAKERRALKSKARNGERANEENGASQPKSKDAAPKAALPRGKKHKLKKMRKYKDQDDEERRIAMAVLGSKPMKEEEEEEEKVEEVEDNVEPEKKEKREQRQEVMRMLDEEGCKELANLQRLTNEALSTLKAQPTAEDQVRYALPVCAPQSALISYRYRVKLMPGTMKRGKAYRTAVTLFLKQAEKDLDKFKQERDAIRICPESEGIHGMIGNVKIVAPGLAEANKAMLKAKQAVKKGKK